jgi:Protein of unknown function (DUF2799)
MNSKWLIIPTSLVVLVLSGCASMNSDECATSDWQAIGFEDGSRGYPANRLGQYRKACAKYGVTPNFQAYQAGNEQGLASYCQPSRGFNLGANGGSYNGVCAAHREGDFVDAYNTGYRLFNLRSRVNVANNQINYKRSALENNHELMKDNEVALIAPDTATEDRIRIIAELKELAESNGQLEAEIDQLISERARHQYDLESYEAILASSGY